MGGRGENSVSHPSPPWASVSQWESLTFHRFLQDSIGDLIRSLDASLDNRWLPNQVRSKVGLIASTLVMMFIDIAIIQHYYDINIININQDVMMLLL